MPRVTKEPEERRQEILDTAMRLFREQGYERTSISDIARAMGVAQGLCYRYFPSKEAMFDAALGQYAQRQADRMAEVLGEPDLTVAQLVERMPTFLETEAEDSDVHRLAHGPEGRKVHDQLALQVCARLQPLVRQCLERANGRGELRLADPAAAASFCVYGQLGLLLDQSLPGPERVRRVKAFLLDLLQAFG